MKDAIISAQMPPKIESLVFCKPSPLQHDLYKALLSSAETQKSIASNKPGGAFAVIARVIKLLNHPTLLLRQDEESGAQSRQDDDDDDVTDLTLGVAGGRGAAVDMDFVMRLFPVDYNQSSLVHSGKLEVLFELLKSVKASSSDRFVLVSNYTTTLDLLEGLCNEAGFSFLRLDGSVTSDKRRDVVASFNRPQSDIFVFLLSSLAGGVGLNLVGANRLVLIDPSWNPAHDLQAMARVWRFGQTKQCHIYRLITSGCLSVFSSP
jgi:SNF2 family DNA or RNA helicase